MEEKLLLIESLGVGGPKQLCLVAEPVVSVERSESVGQNCKPEILSVKSMGFEEASEFRKDRQHDVLSGQLEDSESLYAGLYMPSPLMARAVFWFLLSRS